ncbi:MAG: adenylate kinase [Bdellovibrio sp.]|nr:MAG: adenylate kinase [Bdellovibrio sp.]
MNILLFGPPGAGKGTQSQLLSEQLGFKHISTGDLFRYHIKEQTDLGKKVKAILDRGDLVPDDIVIKMVEQEIEGDGSFILDGFPRTIPQAEALDRMLAEKGQPLGKVFFLKVPEKELVRRLSGRRVCSKCGAVYHIETSPPKQDGICDKCGGKLLQREDDREEAILHRLKVYEENTAPLKKFYHDKGIMVEIDGVGDAQEVFERIKKKL